MKPIKRPICCGKPARPVLENHSHSWIQRFACPVCHNPAVDYPVTPGTHMADMERVRELAVADELARYGVAPEFVEFAI
jgi:hypothetical protein